MLQVLNPDSILGTTLGELLMRAGKGAWSRGKFGKENTLQALSQFGYGALYTRVTLKLSTISSIWLKHNTAIATVAALGEAAATLPYAVLSDKLACLVSPF